jgi:hypothetical protein
VVVGKKRFEMNAFAGKNPEKGFESTIEIGA